MSDPCLIVPLLTKLVPCTSFPATTEPVPNTSPTMNRSQQSNTAAVAPNRGGCEYKEGGEPKKSSKSLRQLIDERLSQSQKKGMSVAATPTPTLTAPRTTTKTDSSMVIPHPPVSKPVVPKSKKSARMQRRQQARQRDASPSPSCSSSVQMQPRQHAQQRNASPSPSCSSTSVTSYSLKVVAHNDNHSHSAAATVCSSSSVSSCSIGTSIRVLAGNKRQQKEYMKNKPAPEHRRMATSRVGKHLSIPTTAALHSSFSPAITVTSVSVPIATAVAQSRNQNHLMSRYSSTNTSPQKQRPQRRQPYHEPHDEKGQVQHCNQEERVFFDFEDNKIIPNPTTTTTNNNNNPRSHIKKPLAQDLSLRKKSDVLRKITKNNTSQSPTLKSQLKREEDSPTKNNKSKDIAGSSSNSKNKIIAPDNSNKQNISMDNGSNKQNICMDNGNINMTQCGGGGGRLSTPLARSRRFQSWSDSRKQKHAAKSSGASLNG